jgi:hypothetical protein
MWPFKPKEKSIPFSEYVKTLPTAPCGKQVKHYRWQHLDGMPCPVCAGNTARRIELEKELRLANTIAREVMRLLSVEKTPN